MSYHTWMLFSLSLPLSLCLSLSFRVLYNTHQKTFPGRKHSVGQWRREAEADRLWLRGCIPVGRGAEDKVWYTHACSTRVVWRRALPWTSGACKTHFVPTCIHRSRLCPLRMQVDIWALGVLLFNMCTDDYPFSASSIPEMRRLIVNGDFIMPSHFSSGKSPHAPRTWPQHTDADLTLPLCFSPPPFTELAHLVGRMIVPEAHDRITTRQLLAHPWVCMAEDGRPVPVHVNQRSMKYLVCEESMYSVGTT